MRKLWLFILVLISVVGCSTNKSGFELSGNLENSNGEVLVLKMMTMNNLEIVDSAKLDESGKFTITGKLEAPNFFILQKDANNYITLIMHPGEKVQISGDAAKNLIDNYEIKGSEDSRLLKEYTGRLRASILELSDMGKVYQDSINSPGLPQLIEEFDVRSNEIGEEMRAFTLNFIDANTGSMATLMALYQQLAPQQYILDPFTDIAYYENVDSILYGKYPESEPVQTLHQHVADFKEQIKIMEVRDGILGIGATPPDIALPDPNGDTLRLSDLRGKVVLLDFWAAWCGPCRKENPNLVSNYKQFHKKGFEIFQVSLDKTKEDWLKGIEDDKLQDWLHASDLQFWNSSVVQAYNIESIPASFLIDRDGRIIAKDLRGTSLGIKLAELFSE